MGGDAEVVGAAREERRVVVQLLHRVLLREVMCTARGVGSAFTSSVVHRNPVHHGGSAEQVQSSSTSCVRGEGVVSYGKVELKMTRGQHPPLRARWGRRARRRWF